jgi:hypothetical protein
MENVVLINNPNYWNRAKSKDIINDIFCELDKENSELSTLTFKNEGLWTENLEYIKNRYILDPKELTKVEVLGKGTIISGSFQFFGKDIMTNIKEGFVIIASHEITSFASYLEERYSNLQKYNEVLEDLKAKEAKQKELKKPKFKVLEKEYPELEEEALEEKLEKKLEKFFEKKKSLEEKINRLKSLRNRIKEDLGMGLLMGSYLLNEAFYLMKNVDPLYINKDYGLLICKINKKANFNYKDFDFLTSLSISSKEDKREVKEIINDYIKSFTNFDFKIKVPLLQGHMSPILNEEVLEVNILTSIDMQDSIPAAPVKPSIAAAMLASGAGGKLDEEILLDEEPCLIKTAITPIQLTETIEINGIEEVSRTYSWEPQLGLFNKLRKEFNILT